MADPTDNVEVILVSGSDESHVMVKNITDVAIRNEIRMVLTAPGLTLNGPIRKIVD